MYRSRLGISPKNGNVLRIEINEILRVARYVMSVGNIKNVSSSRRFGGSVNVVVGGIGGANVEDRALGLARGASTEVTGMSTALGSIVEGTPVVGSCMKGANLIESRGPPFASSGKGRSTRG